MKARLPAGYGSGPQNQKDIMRRAQKMQEEITAKQAELEAAEYKASSGGGMVEATVNGKKEIIGISLKPEVVDPDDIEMLEDLIKAAVNEAGRIVDETASTEMAKVTGGFSIPGMPGMF